MSIRKAVYDLLNDTEADVYPLIAPQETTDPYVVYSMNRTHNRTQTGITVTDVDLTLEIYSTDFSSCVVMADTLSAALENASGTYDTETLMVCNWQSESDDYIPGDMVFNITQVYQLRFSV
jgi:hypothetical protein